MDELIRFTALGVGAGGLYALAAIGLVLIHRSTGVVNFAQGAIGMVGAYVYFEAHVEHGLVWPPAMLLGFGGSALVGVAFHFLVMQRLRSAAALTRIVATIALLVTLQGLAFMRYGSLPKLVPTLLPNAATEIFGTSVGQDRIFILLLAVGLTAALWAIYRFTWFGIATSAVAENQRTAAALAVSPSTIAAANWAIGSALGALASILLVPITGLEPTSASFLVIPVLAAAVIGRFSSFPVTAAAGIAIGVAQSLVTSPKLVTDRWSQPGLATAIPFVLVAIVLISRGRTVAGKDEHFGRMPAVGTGKPAPGLIVAGVGATLLCIWVLFSDQWVVALELQIIVAVVLLSFVVVTGYTGQVSLAQGALAGIGALVCGWLDVSRGWPLELAALAGIAATVPVALVLGLAGVRTRGVNLAIVTLGFAIAIGPAVFTNPSYTGGASGGYAVEQVEVLGIDLSPTATPERYATFALALFVLLGLAVANLRRGRAGRRLLAVRTNERAAAALGVSVIGTKLYAFVLGGIIAAVGGILVAYRQSVLSFGDFGGITSLFVLQNAVLGGVGMLGGPVAGSGFQPGTLGQELADRSPGDAATVVVVVGGFGLLLLLTVAPDGLAELVRRLSRFWLSPLRQALPRRAPDARAPLAAADGTNGDDQDNGDVRRVAPKALAVEGLTVRFGGTTALRDLDLDVAPGEVVGLIGPNGAGKSTAIEAITGFLTPAAGKVSLDGTVLTGWSCEARARAGLCRSFQTLELFDDLTVLENLQAACDERDLAAYVTDLVRPGTGRLTGAARIAIADFGLEDRLGAKAVELSYAERRMLAVARAVAVGSSVLLLDEPAAGLDDVQTRRLGDTIRRLADQRGVAVLLVEHNVDLVLRTCDRIYALDFGRLIGAGTPAEIRADADVVEAYLGTAHLPHEQAVVS
jgi:sulfate-transporting ATPase